MSRTSFRWFAPVSALIVCTFVCADAAASGYAIARFGGEHGTVNAINPTALFYNPGALGFIPGTQLFVDGQLALRSLSWTHSPGLGDAPAPAGFESANIGTADAFNLFGGPMLGATMQFGDLVIGAAAYGPFGGQVHFDRDERFVGTMFPGAADGVARWHTNEVTGQSIYGTLGLAYRLGPVSFGVTGNLIWTTLGYDRAQNLVDGANDLNREGRSYLDVAGIQGSFGVGVMLEAVENKLWFGASYQAQPGLGAMVLTGTLKLDPTVATAGDTASTDADFHQALPDIIRLGARYKPSDRVELRLAGDMTRWSVLKSHCIAVKDQPCSVTPDGNPVPGSGVIANLRRNWKDTFGVRGGGSYWIVPEFELFVGAGYDTAAEPDSTLEPGLADADNIAAALGGRLQVGETWFIAASYTHLQFLTRDNTGKSTLADPMTGVITRRPDGGGVYKQWVGVINANLTKTF